MPVFIGALFLVAGGVALASGSGIAQIDSSVQTFTNVFKVVCAIIGLALFVGILVEFAGHKHLGKMGLEFIGIIVCVLLAVNASSVLSLFGVSSALLR